MLLARFLLCAAAAAVPAAAPAALPEPVRAMIEAAIATGDKAKVAAVPTGMNAGVRISPRRIRMAPMRARPSVASIAKAKRGASEAIDEREAA
jgi:hypothetical protein